MGMGRETLHNFCILLLENIDLHETSFCVIVLRQIGTVIHIEVVGWNEFSFFMFSSYNVVYPLL
jgi:hypothetical protein